MKSCFQQLDGNDKYEYLLLETTTLQPPTLKDVILFFTQDRAALCEVAF